MKLTRILKVVLFISSYNSNTPTLCIQPPFPQGTQVCTSGRAKQVPLILTGLTDNNFPKVWISWVALSTSIFLHGPLARCVNLPVAHARGMVRTFSPPPWVSEPDMHHGTCVTHVPWCMPGSLTSGFLWSRWRGKRSRHSRRMHNLQFYVSGKRSMERDDFVGCTLIRHATRCHILTILTFYICYASKQWAPSFSPWH